MNTMQLGGAAALSLLLVACGDYQNAAPGNRQETNAASQAGATYSAAGKVTTIAGDRVTIAHGPVEGIGWPAMTMTFRAASPEMVQRVSAGDQVAFAFRRHGSAYVLTSLQNR